MPDAAAAGGVRPRIDAALVRRLVGEQFPHWAHLPVTEVPGGWDNRTFRLGERWSVRLPSDVGYVPQVDKEQAWLPRLAPHLPLPIPTPVARGRPGAGYPFAWSVRRWHSGESALDGRIDDLVTLAGSLGEFLVALQRIPPLGPSAGAHSAFRGAHPSVYAGDVRRALGTLGGAVDRRAAEAVWADAVASAWRDPPVWFHGDVAAGNLLVDGGRLTAVLDFGCCGVGDPACDLAVAWTMFSGDSRAAFRAAVGADDETWARGRGWALWKALITLEEHGATDPQRAAQARRVLGEVL